MADDTESWPDDIIPANNNEGPESGPEREAWKRVDRVALTLAGIIGRRMAREDFEAPVAAKDCLQPRLGASLVGRRVPFANGPKDFR